MPTLTQQKRIATPGLQQVPVKGRANGSAASKAKAPAANAVNESVKPKRLHMRRWIAAGLILCTALLTVVFVSNAIKVNELLAVISSVEEERDGIRQENERLRAELLRLMSVEQVTKRATELGMVQPDAAPIALPLSSAGSDSRQVEKGQVKGKE